MQVTRAHDHGRLTCINSQQGPLRMTDRRPVASASHDGQWRARRFIALAAVLELMVASCWVAVSAGDFDAPTMLLDVLLVATPLSFLVFLTAVGAWAHRDRTPVALIGFGLKAVTAAFFTLVTAVSFEAGPDSAFITLQGAAIHCNALGNILLFIAFARRSGGRPLAWGVAIVGCLWIALRMGFHLAEAEFWDGVFPRLSVDLIWLVLMLSLVGQRTTPTAHPTRAWPAVLAGATRFRSAVVWRIMLAVGGVLLMLAAAATRSVGLMLFVLGAMVIGETLIAWVASQGLWRYASVPDESGADLLARSAWAASVVLLMLSVGSAVVLGLVWVDGGLSAFVGTAQKLAPSQAPSNALLALLALGGFLLSVARVGRWLDDPPLRAAAYHALVALVVTVGASLTRSVATGANDKLTLILGLSVLVSAVWLIITLLKTTVVLMQTAENQALVAPFEATKD